MDAIALSSDVGLVALWLLTLNLLLGLLLSVRYNPWKQWPHRRFNYFAIHNWTGYIALAVAVLHPLLLLFSTKAGFGFLDLVYPLRSPKQPVVNTLGAVALYALLLVVVTSYLRRRMDRGLWKAVHYLGYLSAAAFYVHGLLTDPKLQNNPVDWLDAEKVSVEVCLLLVAVAAGWRLSYALRRRREGRRGPGAWRARRVAPESGT